MSQVHGGLVIDVVNGIDIIDCTNCNFKHALITERSPDAYTSRYYEFEKPNYILPNESYI